MTVASALTSLNQDIQNARTAITNKGGTITTGGGSSQLATDIATIPTGGATPSGILIESDGSSATGFILKSVGVSTVSAYQYMFNKFYTFGSTISEVDLSSIKTISGEEAFGYSFQLGTEITTVTIGAEFITGSHALMNAFQGCTKIEHIYFTSLAGTNAFGSYKNQLENMLNSTGNTVIHTIHFPSNMQNTISGLTGYPLFGGTSGYVVCAFDL